MFIIKYATRNSFSKGVSIRAFNGGLFVIHALAEIMNSKIISFPFFYKLNKHIHMVHYLRSCGDLQISEFPLLFSWFKCRLSDICPISFHFHYLKLKHEFLYWIFNFVTINKTKDGLYILIGTEEFTRLLAVVLWLLTSFFTFLISVHFQVSNFSFTNNNLLFTSRLIPIKYTTFKHYKWHSLDKWTL